MFPPGIRDLDQAASYFLMWLDSLGGQLDSPEGLLFDEVQTELGRRVLLLGPVEIRFDAGTRLTVQLTITADLSVPFYRFHFRSDQEPVIWRHDRHTGHQPEDGGSSHLHVGPMTSDRHPHRPVDLDTIWELVTTENLRRST